MSYLDLPPLFSGHKSKHIAWPKLAAFGLHHHPGHGIPPAWNCTDSFPRRKNIWACSRTAKPVLIRPVSISQIISICISRNVNIRAYQKMSISFCISLEKPNTFYSRPRPSLVSHTYGKLDVILISLWMWNKRLCKLFLERGIKIPQTWHSCTLYLHINYPLFRHTAFKTHSIKGKKMNWLNRDKDLH